MAARPFPLPASACPPPLHKHKLLLMQSHPDACLSLTSDPDVPLPQNSPEYHVFLLLLKCC